MSREMRRKSALYHSVLADEEFDDIVKTPVEDETPAPAEEDLDGDDQIQEEIENAEQAIEEASAEAPAEEGELDKVMDDIDDLEEQLDAPAEGKEDDLEEAYAEAKAEARRRIHARIHEMKRRPTARFHRVAIRKKSGIEEQIGDQGRGGDPSVSTLFMRKPLPTMGEAVKKLTARLDFLADECQKNGMRKAAYSIDRISNEIEKGR